MARIIMTKNTTTLLVILQLLFYSLNQVASDEYYIIANSTDFCSTPCQTLSQFVINFSRDLLDPDITLVFSPGIHYLNSNLTVSNSDNFAMTSQNLTAEIRCARYSQVVFNHSLNVDITDLEFIGCGGIQGLRVDRFVARNATFRGQEYSGTALLLIETTAWIINCTFLYIIASLGILYLNSSSATIEQSIFEDNIGLATLLYVHSNAKIYNSEFNNSASSSIIYLSVDSSAILEQNIFENNTGDTILFHVSSSAKIYNNKFHNNSVPNGVLYLLTNSSTIIEKGTFEHNLGIISTIRDNSDIRICMCEFKHNTGSVVLSYNSKVEITTSTFDNNTEEYAAGFPILNEGVILGSSGGSIIVNKSNFTNNNSPVIVALSSTIRHHNSLLIMNNSAADNGYAVIQLDNSEFIGHQSGNAIISDNLRSLIAFKSNISFMGHVKFSNNQQPLRQTIRLSGNFLQEGGAITLVHSSTYLDGTASFEHNHAENGGAIFSIGSKFYVKGDVTVAHNMANKNGGGIYFIDSELNCLKKSTFILLKNTAMHKGGGIHAISSSIKTTSVLPSSAILNFTNNTAERGGGLSLEANAKLVTEKYVCRTALFTYPSYQQSYMTIFSGNSAKYGGAVYVDDDTNSGTCTTDPKTECFFQVFAYIEGLYNSDSIADTELKSTQRNLKPLSLYFTENNASISGSTLYGGLLDRCAVSQSAEVRIKYAEDYETGGNGIQYLEHVSNITESDTSISSRPVKVCLCIDNEHNCTHQKRIEVKKGETFNVSIASIDQKNQPVSGLIHASFTFAGSAVVSGQATREISAKCTNLTFNVLSPHSSEQLTLYALDGPCRNVNLSTISLDIHFLPCSCPIGLQIVGIDHETSCMCKCHRNIRQYVEECDSNTGAFLRKSQSKVWISFINCTELPGYLLYSNCPFDYCNTFNISIDLYQPNGADAQCAFNRSSLLCGSCQPGLSLSLGSARCLQCPTNWPTLLAVITIAAILAGIALVALLLVLNMTVAVGTLNGLIFYANVVYANRSILLPFQQTSLVTVFISLLNLELGIDTCYFPGMVTYTKTWLKLIFPAFVFCLVGLVIVVSSYSIKFSKLIGNKDPVATLATLILLSYAKLLEICFESLSAGILKYPDGSSKALWLPDATVQYLHGKHIPLFIAAVVILLIGLVFTALLFLWQWCFYLSKWNTFKTCLGDQSLKLFIETYHAPFTPKHRYWTGLLLIARSIMYLVAAANVTNDPQLALSAIVFIVICILFLTAFIDIRMYKKIPLNVLDTFFLLNLLFFSVFTWYSLSSPNIDQKAVAYTSVLSTFTILWLIILYHMYTYTKIFSKTKKLNLSRMIKTDITLRARRHLRRLPHGTFNKLLDIIPGPANTEDDNVPLLDLQPAVEPTYSVVELPKPGQHPNQPEPEEANIYSIPGSGITANVVEHEVIQ